MEPGLGQGAQQFQVVMSVELQGQQGLDIGGGRSISTFGLLTGEEASVGTVAGADEVRKTSLCADPFEVKPLFEEAQVNGSAEAGRLAVLDVESGGHFIAVPGLESACVKADATGQLRVDETEPFLLGIVDEVGPKNLKIVYINEVLVVISTADGILGSQLVIGADEDFDETFDSACRGRDIDGVPWVDLDQAGFMRG